MEDLKAILTVGAILVVPFIAAPKAMFAIVLYIIIIWHSDGEISNYQLNNLQIMEALQIMPVMAQRRNCNLGEFAEDATVVTDDTKGKRPLFIEANTVEATLQHLRDDCIIPVFAKDNEATLSHVSFIETVQDAAHTFFNGERIGQPDIRVSHVIKGRIPEAIHKPANQLLESDKTIYYERCAFVIEIPTIYETVNGNRLTLTVGGVRAYNHTNLYSKRVQSVLRCS